MGNEQSGGCFRSSTLGKSRTQLYDMGRVTPNNDQANINQYNQSFPFIDQKVKKRQSMSLGNIHQPIFQIQKNLTKETQIHFREKNGRTQSKSDYLNHENLESERVKKKAILSQEIISQVASLQGKNSTQTNDSQRPSMVQKIIQRKQDSLDSSEMSLTNFNLPLETIIRPKEKNEQNEVRNKSNERVKDKRNERPKQRKSERLNVRMDTTKLNCQQRMNMKQISVQKQKKKRKNEEKRRQQKSLEDNNMKRMDRKEVNRSRQRIQRGQDDRRGENRNVVGIQVMNKLNSYGL